MIHVRKDSVETLSDQPGQAKQICADLKTSYTQDDAGIHQSA